VPSRPLHSSKRDPFFRTHLLPPPPSPISHRRQSHSSILFRHSSPRTTRRWRSPKSPRQATWPHFCSISQLLPLLNSFTSLNRSTLPSHLSHHFYTLPATGLWIPSSNFLWSEWTLEKGCIEKSLFEEERLNRDCSVYLNVSLSKLQTVIMRAEWGVHGFHIGISCWLYVLLALLIDYACNPRSCIS